MKSRATQSTVRSNSTVHSSGAARAAFGAFVLLLFFAPSQLSLFWPVTDDYYDYLPQAMFSAFTALACVLVALEARGANAETKGFSSVAWCVAGFAFWVSLSVLGAIYLHDALLETARVASVVAWFFIARAVLRRTSTVEFERACLYIFGAIALGAVWVATASALGFLRTRAPQLSLWFTNNNLFANYCAMALPMSLGLAVLVRRLGGRLGGARFWLVALCLLGAAWIALGLLSSASKGGLLAALCGAVAFGVVMLRARGDAVRNIVRKRRALAFLVAIVLVGGGGVVGARTVLPRILAARGSQNHSTMFRVYTWRAAAEMAAARPLAGFGAGAFPWAGQKFSQVGYTRIAHQSWLQIAAESGVPALLFLLGATVLALRRGWRAAKQEAARWPVVAGASGAVVAFAVHALTDAGWGIISIATLLVVALALLDACAAPRDQQSTVEIDRTHSASPRGFLAWLGLALVVGGASWIAQRAATGEDERRLSREAAARGKTARSLELATAATRSDPMGVRIWTNAAQAHEAARQNPDEFWARAVAVCPLGAQAWRQWAGSRVRRGLDAEEQFNKAIEIAPRDTETRKQRAEWRTSRNDIRAIDDWSAIETLSRQPYGLYAATPEIVDLNYARAIVELARDDIWRGRRVEAAARLRDATKMLEQARDYQTNNAQFLEAARGAGAQKAASQERETLQAQTHELQAQLK